MFTNITSFNFNSLVLLALGAAFTVVLLANAMPIAVRLRLIDRPDGVRKNHARPTPLMGGVAIWAGMVVWLIGTLCAGPTEWLVLIALLLCGSGAWVIGFIDDHRNLTPSVRIVALFGLSIAAMLIAPALLPTTINWVSMPAMAVPAWLGLGFMAFAMAGYVNAVNMADGQNGVVGGMMMIWSLCLMLVTRGVLFELSATLLACIGCFFLFNIAGRVFLGDSGTYGLGFVFGLLAALAHNHFGVAAETVCVWFFIPVLDCLRLLIERARRGVSPMRGDRDHFHHRLQDKIGHRGGLAVYLLAAGITSILSTVAPQTTLLCLILLASFYFSFAWLSGSSDESLQEKPQAEVVQLSTRGRSKAPH